jgi:hypothetical protein
MSHIRDSKQLQVWTDRLREFRCSEQTVREFCERLGISQATYYYWKRRLRCPSTKPVRAKQRDGKTRRSVTPMRSFLPVIVKPLEPAHQCLSIELPKGVVIRVPMEVASSVNEVA